MQSVSSDRVQRARHGYAARVKSVNARGGCAVGGGGRENDRVMIWRRERYTENCRRMGTGSTLPLIRTKNVIIKSFLMKHLFVGNCTAIDAPPGFACVILTQFWFLKWFIIGGDGAV